MENSGLRKISVSTVAFDGHAIDVAFATLAELGVGLVEPAHIKGYMDFSEDDFSEVAASRIVAKLKQHGLRSIAISAHMDSEQDDAVNMLTKRIRFAAGIGANYTITNSSTLDRQSDFEKCIEANLPLAEELGVVIALENPGNGVTNLMRDGKSGAALVRRYNSDFVKLNYDTANALTCTEGDVRPETDIDFAFSCAAHMHLKDVVGRAGSWRYRAIGSGDIDYAVILQKLKTRPEIPLTLELPLRLIRQFHQEPKRDSQIPSIADISQAIRSSWNCLAVGFGDLTRI